MEVVASLSQGRTAAAQCGLFTHKSVPVIFEPPCILRRKCALRVTYCRPLGYSYITLQSWFVTMVYIHVYLQTPQMKEAYFLPGKEPC